MVIPFALAGTSSVAVGLETVTVTGSTTVMPLVEVSAEEFNILQSGIMVTVSGVGGSGVGIKNVASGFSDIGMSSRAVREGEVGPYGAHLREYLVG